MHSPVAREMVLSTPLWILGPLFLPHSVEHYSNIREFCLTYHHLSGSREVFDGSSMHFFDNGSESLMMCWFQSTNCTRPHGLIMSDAGYACCDHRLHVHGESACHHCHCMMKICGLKYVWTKRRLQDLCHLGSIVPKMMRALFIFLSRFRITATILPRSSSCLFQLSTPLSFALKYQKSSTLQVKLE